MYVQRLFVSGNKQQGRRSLQQQPELKNTYLCRPNRMERDPQHNFISRLIIFPLSHITLVVVQFRNLRQNTLLVYLLAVLPKEVQHKQINPLVDCLPLFSTSYFYFRPMREKRAKATGSFLY